VKRILLALASIPLFVAALITAGFLAVLIWPFVLLALSAWAFITLINLE